MKPPVTITLTHEEAIWLKAVVQNPLHEDETTKDAQMRALLWSALPSEQNGYRSAPNIGDVPY